MTLRFTDTIKWQNDWFSSLSNDDKIIWLYILDNCTFTGRWPRNFRLLNFNCNTNIDQARFEKLFEGRVFYSEHGDFYFIPEFIKQQNPKGLTMLPMAKKPRPAILSTIKDLEYHNLLPTLRQALGKAYPIDEKLLEWSHDRPKGTGKGEGKGVGKEKGTGTGTYSDGSIAESVFDEDEPAVEPSSGDAWEEPDDDYERQDDGSLKKRPTGKQPSHPPYENEITLPNLDDSEQVPF